MVNRMNRSRNQPQFRRRRFRGARQQRVIPRQRVALSANRTAVRTLRATARVFLQFPNTSQGGVEGNFAFSNPVQDYVGSTFVSDNFEQYSVMKVKVLMKPSSAALNQGSAPSSVAESIAYQNSVYSLMNNTEVQSFIDYDSDLAPTYNECLTRPNLRMRALSPNNWTTVAQYSPKSLSNPSNTAGVPSITFSSAKWMTTNNMSTIMRGLRGRVSNRSPLFDTQDNVACVDVMFAMTVRMRGFKNTQGLTPIPPLPFETNTREDEIKPESPTPLKMPINGNIPSEPQTLPQTLKTQSEPLQSSELLSFTPAEEALIRKMKFFNVVSDKLPEPTLREEKSIQNSPKVKGTPAAPFVPSKSLGTTTEDIKLLPCRARPAALIEPEYSDKLL